MVFSVALMGAAGGALLFLVGAYIADAVGWLKGDAKRKTSVVIFTGSAVVAVILGGFVVPKIGITLLNTLIAFAINAGILAWIYSLLPKKLGLIPF